MAFFNFFLNLKPKWQVIICMKLLIWNWEYRYIKYIVRYLCIIDRGYNFVKKDTIHITGSLRNLIVDKITSILVFPFWASALMVFYVVVIVYWTYTQYLSRNSKPY